MITQPGLWAVTNVLHQQYMTTDIFGYWNSTKSSKILFEKKKKVTEVTSESCSMNFMQNECWSLKIIFDQFERPKEAGLSVVTWQNHVFQASICRMARKWPLKALMRISCKLHVEKCLRPIRTPPPWGGFEAGTWKKKTTSKKIIEAPFQGIFVIKDLSH